MPEEKKVKDESIKERSGYLRGTIKEELKKNTPRFEEENTKLLKFHGIYQQDDRDIRQERIKNKEEKAYSFMIRTKLPGGKLTPEQYLKLNEISDKYTNKTLRITTRQTIQFHSIIKGDLHKTLNEINKELITSYGGCGDVVRNVMAPPVADIDPDYPSNLIELATKISNHFLPASRAYFEVWVENDNGEKTQVNKKEESEPLYGKTYLPRKFKIGIGIPEDNSVDLFTQDIGIVALKDGFNILAGGGLGHHHNKPETYPRLASELCFVTQEKLITVLEKIVTIQRDFGGRENRKHARMKYLIDDRGLGWFKKELEKRLDYKLEEPKEIKEYKICDYLGWHKQRDGKWYRGIFIENGRIKDDSAVKTKSGLKEIIERFKTEVRLTPQQNILLLNIDEKNKAEIDKSIEQYGFYDNKKLSSLRRNSLACVALPTCGLALAEAERALPGIIDELENLGYGDKNVSIRMSGCPNSCSRPPVAEIGIIGTSANKYNIYAGGKFNGTKLNKIVKESVSGENIVSEVRKLLDE